MSVWTHVNGCVRIDGLPFPVPGMKTPEELLGPMSVWDNWNDDCRLPMGSEGSLRYHVWQADDNSLAKYTVSIFGDLRDFDDLDTIERWIKDTFVGQDDPLMIRNFIIEAHVEGGEGRIWRVVHDEEIPEKRKLIVWGMNKDTEEELYKEAQ